MTQCWFIGGHQRRPGVLRPQVPADVMAEGLNDGEFGGLNTWKTTVGAGFEEAF